jgi:hypothetical protein
MSKKLSTTVETQVKREFNYLCAICGKPNPHIHHIDGNHSNNEVENLLPLCPNHHLLDAHSPTDPIDPLKLKLFRRHRDPAILLPQFQPLFRRMRFLFDIDVQSLELRTVAAQASELIDFVSYLEIGGFYRDQLTKLIGWNPGVRYEAFDQPAEYYAKIKREQTAEYSAQLSTGVEPAVALIVELLRFQPWKQSSPYTDA